MTFQEKVKTSIFWKNVIKISITFFVILIIISLLFNSFSSVIDFDLQAIKSQNFTEGKWKAFFFTKLVVSVLYGIWVTNRSLK